MVFNKSVHYRPSTDQRQTRSYNEVPYAYNGLFNYIGKNLSLQVYDIHLSVYYNATLISIHSISSKKLNYLKQHIYTTNTEHGIFENEAAATSLRRSAEFYYDE